MVQNLACGQTGKLLAPVAAQIQGHHQSPTHAVLWRPSLAAVVQDRCAQNFELGGRLDRTALPRSLDAVAVGLQCRLGGRRQALELLLGHADDAQGAHQFVGVQGGLAQNFGQLAAHQTAVKSQLPATLLGVYKTHGAPSVNGIARFNVCDIGRISDDVHRGRKAFDMKVTVELRHATQQMHAEGPTCCQNSGQGHQKDSCDPFHMCLRL